MSSTVIRCPAIRGFPPAIPGVVSISGCTGASVQIGTTGARRRQGYRPPTLPVRPEATIRMARDLSSLANTEHRGNVALCGLRAAAAVLMAALVTAGCRTAPQVQDTGGTSPGQPQTGSGGGPAEAAWGRTRQSRPLHRGGDHQASVAAAKDRAARMTEAAVDELRRLGVEDRDMETKVVQHPARLSVHGRVARPDRLPGPRTDGVAPPDAPTARPATGALLRAESIDTPPPLPCVTYSPCGDGTDV